MKKVMIGAMALTAGLLLTGCSDDRENVSKDFVMALSNADIKKAKSLSDGKTLETLARYEETCSENNLYSTFKDYAKERNWLLELAFEKSKEKKAELAKLQEEFKPKFDATKEAKPEQEEEFAKKHEVVKEFLQKMFDIAKVEVAPSIMDVMAWNFAGLNRDESFEKVRKVHAEEMTRTCYAMEAFDGDMVKTINTLEMKEISPDKAEVRLELINKKNASNKITISVEKINGEWKAIDSKKDKS